MISYHAISLPNTCLASFLCCLNSSCFTAPVTKVIGLGCGNGVNTTPGGFAWGIALLKVKVILVQLISGVKRLVSPF